MTALMDEWDDMDYEYERYLNFMLEAYEAEQERAYEEWYYAQMEDSTRYPEEEDWSEDDFPR